MRLAWRGSYVRRCRTAAVSAGVIRGSKSRTSDGPACLWARALDITHGCPRTCECSHAGSVRAGCSGCQQAATSMVCPGQAESWPDVDITGARRLMAEANYSAGSAFGYDGDRLTSQGQSAAARRCRRRVSRDRAPGRRQAVTLGFDRPRDITRAALPSFAFRLSARTPRPPSRGHHDWRRSRRLLPWPGIHRRGTADRRS
jgi:hypothetical protein